METQNINHKKRTKKEVRNIILFCILICVPLLYIFYESTRLYLGLESLGVTGFYSTPSQFFSYFLGEYIVRIVSFLEFILVGCFSFGIMSSMGGCFIFPFAPTVILIILTGIFSIIITSIAFRVNKIENILNFAKWCARVAILFYFVIYIGHSIVISKNEKIQLTRLDNFNKTYTFSSLVSDTRFIYFDWVINNMMPTQKLTISNLDGSNKTVLTEITIPNKAGETKPVPEFPSPKGTYYLLVGDYGNSDSFVKDMNGTDVFKIPDIFPSFAQGVASWSLDERFLAIYSEKRVYPQTPGLLMVYDLSQKRKVASIEGSSYGGFSWGKDDTLYHSCGEHLCRTYFLKNALPSTEILTNTVNCSPLLFLNEKIYCAVSSGVAMKISGKTIPSPLMPTDGTGGIYGNSYIISQNIDSNNSLSDSVNIITQVPLRDPRTLSVIDSGHIAVTAYGGIYMLAAVDLKSGKIMDLGQLSGNVFSTLTKWQNIGDLPVVYTGEQAK